MDLVIGLLASATGKATGSWIFALVGGRICCRNNNLERVLDALSVTGNSERMTVDMNGQLCI